MLNRGHLDANLRSITIYALYFPAIEFLTSLALAILLVAGAHRVGAGTLSVGVVAAFLQLLRRFYQPLQDLADKFNTLQQAMAASERIFLLLDTEPAVAPLADRETVPVLHAVGRRRRERAARRDDRVRGRVVPLRRGRRARRCGCCAA